MNQEIEYDETPAQLIEIPSQCDGIDESLVWTGACHSIIGGGSTHCHICEGTYNAILNSHHTELHNCHHVIIDGVDSVEFRDRSYLIVTKDGEMDVTEQEFQEAWEAAQARA